MDDQLNQVYGYTYINDESGLLMGHVSLWSLTDIKAIMGCIQVRLAFYLPFSSPLPLGQQHQHQNHSSVFSSIQQRRTECVPRDAFRLYPSLSCQYYNKELAEDLSRSSGKRGNYCTIPNARRQMNYIRREFGKFMHFLSIVKPEN